MDLNIQADLEELRQTFNSGKTKDASWRRSQLKGLLSLLKEREDDIFKALWQDLGKHQCEAYRDEIGTITKSVNYALDGLKNWMSSKKVTLPIVAFPSAAELVPEPLGLVLIISSWNFPFGLSFEPLIGAIAAGNVVVLKPSELASSCSSLLANSISTYLDNKAIKVIQGGVSIGMQLLQHKWDKIFFTGSTQVGRIVTSPAAANHLTPVTLELGGKCPAVVDSISSSWDRESTIKRILAGKFGICAGQACIGIDYILVEKRFASTLVSQLKIWIKKMFGENPKESVARIINSQHFLRLKNLLNDPAVEASIIYGGSFDENNLSLSLSTQRDKNLSKLTKLVVNNKRFDGRTQDSPETLFKQWDKANGLTYTQEQIDEVRGEWAAYVSSYIFIEPTILMDPPLKAAIMTEEIFGPFLPIITLEKIEDSIEFINSRPNPLTIYAFTNDEKFKKRLISETSSGSLTFNDTIIQYAADTIPFGGVGQSGFGRYHGKFSFDTFTHEKAVLRRSFLTDFWFRYPPWNEHKLQLFKHVYKFDYLGVVLTTLGLKKS